MLVSTKRNIYMILGYLIFIPIIWILFENLILYCIFLFIFVKVWNIYLDNYFFEELKAELKEKLDKAIESIDNSKKEIEKQKKIIEQANEEVKKLVDQENEEEKRIQEDKKE